MRQELEAYLVPAEATVQEVDKVTYTGLPCRYILEDAGEGSLDP